MLILESSLRNAVAAFLGRKATEEELKNALPKAERKLQWILTREGDANGSRLQPWYLGKLIQEAIESETIKKQLA